MDASMSRVFSGNSGVGVLTGASDNPINIQGRLDWEVIMSVTPDPVMWWFDDESPNVTLSEIEFQEQKRMFNEIPPLLLEQYRGMFVASRNGQIVDSDADFTTLAHRFFQNFGDVAVYVTKIGHDDGVFIDTPFFD
jgi:hypothetical protein